MIRMKIKYLKDKIKRIRSKQSDTFRRLYGVGMEQVHGGSRNGTSIWSRMEQVHGVGTEQVYGVEWNKYME